MTDDNEVIKTLRAQINDYANQIETLERNLIRAQHAKTTPNGDRSFNACVTPKQPTASKQEIDSRWPLDADEYKRYGRQMIVPQVGIDGCFSLSNHVVDGMVNSIFA